MRLGTTALVLLGAGVITALLGRAVDRDLSRVCYVLWSSGAVAFLIACMLKPISIPRHVARRRLQIGLGLVLSVWYLADVVVNHRIFEQALARGGIGVAGARCLMPLPVVLMAALIWLGRRDDAHGPEQSPNNRWRGP